MFCGSYMYSDSFGDTNISTIGNPVEYCIRERERERERERVLKCIYACMLLADDSFCHLEMNKCIPLDGLSSPSICILHICTQL